MSKIETKDEIYTVAPDSPVLPDKFDCRVRRRHLTRGVVSLEDLKVFAKNLPDDAVNAEFRDFEALVKDDGSDAFSNLSNANRGTVTPSGTTTH